MQKLIQNTECTGESWKYLAVNLKRFVRFGSLLKNPGFCYLLSCLCPLAKLSMRKSATTTPHGSTLVRRCPGTSLVILIKVGRGRENVSSHTTRVVESRRDANLPMNKDVCRQQVVGVLTRLHAKL